MQSKEKVSGRIRSRPFHDVHHGHDHDRGRQNMMGMSWHLTLT